MLPDSSLIFRDQLTDIILASTVLKWVDTLYKGLIL